MSRQILFVIGVPASGKSTWAKQVTKDNNNWVRISRDDYRLMLQQSQFMKPSGEKLITKLVEQAIAEATAAKFNVIIDQTNVNLKYLRSFVKYCRQYGDVSFKVFDVALDVAIERDAKREASVGQAVIRSMYSRYEQLIVSDFAENLEEGVVLPQLPFVYTKPEYDPALDDAVICDLDGTLFHSNGERGHYDWGKCKFDQIDYSVIELLDALDESGYKIIFVTSRDEDAREGTLECLAQNNVVFEHLLMRKKGDNRRDTVVKREIYENSIQKVFNVRFVFEDRDRCVDMWRKLGLKCYQPQKGTF